MTDRRSLLLGSMALAPLAAQTSSPAAPQTAASQLVSIARVRVKPDRVAEWLEIEKKYSAAFKEGGGRYRLVYRNRAGNPFEYGVMSSLDKYANLDDKSPYAKGMSETELAALQARRNQCIEGVRVTYERSIPELGIYAPPGWKLARLTRVTVKPGLDEQYLGLMKSDYVPALKKAGVTAFMVRRVEWGGSRNEFSLAGRHEKFGELDEGSVLTKSMGAEASAKMLGRLRQTLSSSEYLLYSFVPESSYLPPAA